MIARLSHHKPIEWLCILFLVMDDRGQVSTIVCVSADLRAKPQGSHLTVFDHLIDLPIGLVNMLGSTGWHGQRKTHHPNNR